MLRIDNIARIIGNRFDDRNDLEYKRVFLELNNEILNVLKILKIVKQSKKNINTTDLEELKTYYLSMRFLIYYYKLLMYNYGIKVNELINLEKGITVIINEVDKTEEVKTKDKIREYYEVKNGKSKKFRIKL